MTSNAPLIRDFMTPGPHAIDRSLSALRPAMTCSPFAHLSSVLRDMERRRLDDVVVLDRSGEVVGIFTQTDASPRHVNGLVMGEVMA